MTRAWFANELETVATWWRIVRRDGVTLGFASHDRDLWFDGVLHRAAPGMIPAAIRKSAGLDADSSEVQGALSHDAITAADLAAGRYDGARIRIGVIDWESGEREGLYAGTMGSVSQEDGAFTAELVSRKAELFVDDVPRTSPACRAEFCGSGCNLNPQRFTREVRVAAVDVAANSVTFEEPLEPSLFIGGRLRWIEGPQAGIAMGVSSGEEGATLVLDLPLAPDLASGTRAFLREGCDHTIGTCADRFANALNFRGEPYLPGNDLLLRYPGPQS